jgi:hypothetical protein
MEDANNGLNILLLDACRNMPFSRSFRSGQGGLAVPPTSPRGMLIAYATSPGGMAADGTGENGVYTKHLLDAIPVPGLSIEQVFKQVRYGVVTETEGKQTPWESSSLLGDFAFVPGQANVVPTGVPPYSSSVSDPETVLWSMSERSSHPEDVLAFLQAYPQSRFAPAARLRLQQLQQQSATASNVPTTPPPAPATPPRAEEPPPSSSTSAASQPPPERTVPPSVSSAKPPREEAGQTNPMASLSPAPSAAGYTLIRRIYCEDPETGAVQGRTELKFTSPQSCEEAKNALLAWERQRDHCRFPKTDSDFVDPTARESQHKAKEWIGTPSCRIPS